MKYIKMFEAYEMPPRPDTNSKWIKVGEEDRYTPF
jgi:hypothetical protein